MFLPDQSGVLRRVHAGEVKHGHVRLPVVVDGEVEGRQLVVCAEVGGLAGVRVQRLLVDVGRTQQALCLRVVLRRDEGGKAEAGITDTGQ